MVTQVYIHGRLSFSEELSEKTYLVEIEFPEERAPKPRPFQFLLVWVPGTDLLPMSVAGFREDEVALIVKEKGEGTARLVRYKGFIGVMGPYGAGFEPWSYNRILFVAGGSGVAPFFYLAEEAAGRGVTVDLAWGVRRGSEFFTPLRVVRELKGKVWVATEDCSIGYCGRASDLAVKLVKENPDAWDAIIASGPRGLLREACNLLSERIDVYVNVEAYVKCGIGVCGSCTLKPHKLLLCRHGPVFKCSDVRGYI
ncbi:MAG: dihydroorotate dehydrogenase [Desulfurococcus sp.]|nr:dihydroorotate dehydrogenase [Desulfurococcus sp.]